MMNQLKKTAQKIARHMSATQLMASGFMTAVLLGGLLLSLPVCNRDGRWLNFADSLFTACSAVCVTGLVTVVPAQQFTLIGKLVLLVLIQFGGLGIIVCTMAAFLILHRQITIRSQVMLQEGFHLHTMSGLVAMLVYVLKGTFLAEGAGALLYSFAFVPQYGWLRGIWYSVFHSVSAFCNAGIDILGETSLQMYRTNVLVNFTTIGLIMVSGIGFTVWRDLALAVQRILRREFSVRRALQKMRLHTKLALIMTGVLVLTGTAGFFLMEYTNPDTFGPLSAGEKWMAAMFQSVTTRTAGFLTVPQEMLREESKLLSCMLMFIGGSPGGTAGGVKTTTMAILLLTCWSVLKGDEDTECFRRRILETNVRTGFAVFTVAFSAVLLGTMAILILEGAGLTDALYEVTSAVATVGLSTGLTPLLSVPGKLTVILLMYMGRIGPATLALLFAGKIGKNKNGRTLPKERVMVG